MARRYYKTKGRHGAARVIQAAFRARRSRRNTKSTQTGISGRTISMFHNGELHNFVRTTYLSNQTLTCNGDGFAADTHAFRFADLGADTTKFQALFDVYKIRKIVMEMIPVSTNNPTNNEGTTPQLFAAKIIYAKDYDDDTTPTSIENLLNRKGSYLTNFNSKKAISLSPATAVPIYDGTLSYGYKQDRNSWLDCNDPNIKYYGIKLALQAAPNQRVTFHLRTKYFMSFKEPIKV